MAWEGSTRKETLPPDWNQIRLEVFARDGNRCVIIKANGQRCWDRESLECDHIGDRNDHSPANLRTICSWHHQRRSSMQGGTASANARRSRPSLKRPPEQHPGLIQSR
jgi:hypothetical protein